MVIEATVLHYGRGELGGSREEREVVQECHQVCSNLQGRTPDITHTQL